jgi:hypothetical protein
VRHTQHLDTDEAAQPHGNQIDPVDFGEIGHVGGNGDGRRPNSKEIHAVQRRKEIHVVQVKAQSRVPSVAEVPNSASAKSLQVREDTLENNTIASQRRTNQRK